MKVQVVIKSPSSFYGGLFKGRKQVVEPPFATESEADRFIEKNKEFDRRLNVAYRYYKRRLK